MSAACAAMSVATTASPCAALHWYAARRLPSSSSTQSTASRHPGPFQCSHRTTASPGEVLARGDRTARSSAPVSARRSSANWRMVSNCRYRVRVARVVGDDERLADQRVEMPEHVDVVAAVDDGDDARQLEAAGEHRRGAEELLLVVGEEVVGPLHGLAERELAFRTLARSLQQPEPIGEAIPDLDGAHRGHARRGQLDAEREPVERLADLGHRRGGGLIAEAEVGPHRARPVDEEGDGIGGLRRPRRRGERRRTGLRRRARGPRATWRGS